MHVATLLSFLLLVQLGHYGGARPDSTACTTRRKCDEQRQTLRLTKFYVGDYPTKGCFHKRGKAYFGIGGSPADKATVILSGEQKRIWCQGPARSTSQQPTSAPTAPPPTRSPSAQPTGASPSRSSCLTENECDLRRQDLGIARYTVGNFPTKGCFSKGETAYFGTGGADADKVESLLAGAKQRIWCDIDIQTSQTGETARCIDIRVNTKELRGTKAGFTLSTKLSDGSAPDKLLHFPVGSLDSESEYAERVCDVPEGMYTLTVAGRSTYSARVAGQEVLFGSNAWNIANSHDILVGDDPALGENERAWVDEHNARREAFHAKHNTEYRPLRWSSALAEGASKWADKIATACEATTDPRLEEGEIVALNRYNSRNGPASTEVPANILTRWSEQKMDRGYPKNQSLTQVMWRATRYVGCATKVAKNDNGSYCHASVCRYSRPGNCGMSAEHWLVKTLDDHSLCGKACPADGCH